MKKLVVTILFSASLLSACGGGLDDADAKTVSTFCERYKSLSTVTVKGGEQMQIEYVAISYLDKKYPDNKDLVVLGDAMDRVEAYVNFIQADVRKMQTESIYTKMMQGMDIGAATSASSAAQDQIKSSSFSSYESIGSTIGLDKPPVAVATLELELIEACKPFK